MLLEEFLEHAYGSPGRPIPDYFTSAEWASLLFLYNLDSSLHGPIRQLYSRLLGTPDDVGRLVALFDLHELQTRASQVMKRKCAGAHLLAIGAYNVVYLLPFDDGTDIVARLRIPSGSHQQPGLNVSAKELADRFVSEIATLNFLTMKTSIPVPSLYYSDGDENNPVRAPYMLMQRISGRLFADVRKQMTPARWRKLVAQVAGFEVELYDNPLRSIGSLVDADGTVGPLVRSCTTSLLPAKDRGPYKSSKQYMLAYVDIELDGVKATDEWIASRTLCSQFNGGPESLPAEYAIQWFQLLRDAIMKLPEELPTCPPVFRLVHCDFTAGNLLFSSSEDGDPMIVAVLDWEGARVLPAWDARAGCNIWWMLQILEEEQLKTDLCQIYSDVIFMDGRKIGRSPLDLEDVMDHLAWAPSLMQSRSSLDGWFLSWFAKATMTGGNSCASELAAFQALKIFIEDHHV